MYSKDAGEKNLAPSAQSPSFAGQYSSTIPNPPSGTWPSKSTVVSRAVAATNALSSL
jgi:hypothetical protein